MVEGFWGFVPPPLAEAKIAKSPTAQVNTLSPKTWSHPESNGDPRFRKPLLYPLELWDRLRLIEVIFRLDRVFLYSPLIKTAARRKKQVKILK